MNNEDLLNAGMGYAAGHSIARGIAGNLRRQREEMEKKLAHITSEDVLSAEVAKFLLKEDKTGAKQYLDDHFSEEIIDAAQHQTDYIYSLETILKRTKDKYNPFYERIGMPMPENLASITADKLCQMVGVENQHINDSTNKETSPSYESDSNKGWVIALIICVIATFILLAIVNSCTN